MSHIQEVRLEIIKQFGQAYELNDPAHQQDHFDTVFLTAVHINDDQNLGFELVHMLFAAYFHDLFAWSRINHHEMSHLWMMGTDHPLIVQHLNPVARKAVAMACLQHRASYKGDFHSTFTALINSADRGFPNDVPGMVERSRKYWLANRPHMSEDERMAGVIGHIKEKFGHNGYARYPELYVKTFGDQLTAMREEVERL
jgi:hypothetical protein